MCASCYADDTILSTDRGCLITYSNANPVTVTLPQAGTSGFAAGFFVSVVNLGVGEVTITPTISTIQDEVDLNLGTGKGVAIASDGTNYFDNPGSGLTVETDTLAMTVGRGRVVTSANSLTNAVCIGAGTNPACIYEDDARASRPQTDATPTPISDEPDLSVDHVENSDAVMFTPTLTRRQKGHVCLSDWAPPTQIILLPAGLSTDGTNCATPAEATPVKRGQNATVLCLDNDGSRMHASFDMPDDYDGGSIHCSEGDGGGYA